MKNNHTLQNQKGSALFEIVVAMAILMVVLTSLIISMTYAQYKSITNYHDRIALLKADSELQIIKYTYEKTHLFGSLPTKEFIMKSSNSAKPIKAKITFSSDKRRDQSLGTDVYYTAITATVTWEEYKSILKPSFQSGQKRTIILREDYYASGS